jgi:hypothetical protein
MASFLLLDPIILTNNEINNVLNATNLIVNNNNYHLQHVLLPQLNIMSIQMGYEGIIDQDNMSVHLISYRSNFRTYFCKNNNQVYEVITDSLTQNIFSVTLITPNIFQYHFQAIEAIEAIEFPYIVAAG